ncbi:hypothetical protein HEK131_18350 [Streptomyces seoulensis]|nr:hypothetical protein HEK131_18350 [Streptomyces seoulensis]
MRTHIEAVFRNPESVRGVLSLSDNALRGVRRGMAAPPDGGGPDVTAGIPANEGEHASSSAATGAGARRSTRSALWEGIGNRMEPDRPATRLSGDVARMPYGDAEVTEERTQV